MDLFLKCLGVSLGIPIIAIIGTVIGAAVGWIVGLLFGHAIGDVFVAFGAHDIALWKLGALLGFVSIFFSISPK